MLTASHHYAHHRLGRIQIVLFTGVYIELCSNHI
jgi:hypothetical protein